MLYDLLPVFITNNICFNPWLASRSPDGFLSQGGTVDSSIWNRLENNRHITSYRRAQSISGTPRKMSYAENRRRSNGSKLHRKLTPMIHENQSPFKT